MPVSYQMPMDRRGWQHFVRAYLKAIMLLRGFTYQTLSEALSSKLGVEMHADQLRKLIHRGAFKAEFLLQCAVAMGIESLDMPRFESPRKDSSDD